MRKSQEELTSVNSPLAEIKSYDPDSELESPSENLHICANEPSLALYRLSEHVKKTLPPTIRCLLQGAYFDADYSLASITSMEKANESMKMTQELLKNSIFLVQQIKYERTR
ncbi:UPF0402 protein CG32590, partial [Caligus rogercresseyi]